MQVVVTQQSLNGTIISHAPAQYVCGGGTPVDQITQQINRVAAGRKTNRVQKSVQCVVAALDVAYAINGHGVKMRVWEKEETDFPRAESPEDTLHWSRVTGADGGKRAGLVDHAKCGYAVMPQTICKIWAVHSQAISGLQMSSMHCDDAAVYLALGQHAGN